MKFFLHVFLFFSTLAVFSQETKLPAPMIAVDSLYREDQFYLGFSYNILLDRPEGIRQNKFSSGFTGGFLRDIPINKKRTLAIATGLGVSYFKYFQNMVVAKSNDVAVYNPATPGVDYRKNKFDQIFIDIPIEFRWRNSTPESHKFWRLYSGVKFSYNVANSSRYTDNQYDIKVTQNDDFNKLQAGPYVAFGYNTWNFYGYYGLIPILKTRAKVNNDTVSFHTLNLGVMFYIL